MQQRRATRQCPIPRCVNRTWASRGLEVCGDCARVIAHIVDGEAATKASRLDFDNQHLRLIIAQQTAELRALKGLAETDTVKAERPTDGVVYFLRSGGYIKIGWTSDLSKRMRAYAPDSILLAVQPGTRKDENRLHKKFAAHRTHGREWFAMVPSVMHHIEQVAAEHGAPDPVAFAAQPVGIPQPRQVERISIRGGLGRAL